MIERAKVFQGFQGFSANPAYCANRFAFNRNLKHIANRKSSAGVYKGGIGEVIKYDPFTGKFDRMCQFSRRGV